MRGMYEVCRRPVSSAVSDIFSSPGTVLLQVRVASARGAGDWLFVDRYVRSSIYSSSVAVHHQTRLERAGTRKTSASRVYVTIFVAVFGPI